MGLRGPGRKPRSLWFTDNTGVLPRAGGRVPPLCGRKASPRNWAQESWGAEAEALRPGHAHPQHPLPETSGSLQHPEPQGAGKSAFFLFSSDSVPGQAGFKALRRRTNLGSLKTFRCPPWREGQLGLGTVGTHVLWGKQGPWLSLEFLLEHGGKAQGGPCKSTPMPQSTCRPMVGTTQPPQPLWPMSPVLGTRGEGHQEVYNLPPFIHSFIHPTRTYCPMTQGGWNALLGQAPSE